MNIFHSVFVKGRRAQSLQSQSSFLLYLLPTTPSRSLHSHPFAVQFYCCIELYCVMSVLVLHMHLPSPCLIILFSSTNNNNKNHDDYGELHSSRTDKRPFSAKD